MKTKKKVLFIGFVFMLMAAIVLSGCSKKEKKSDQAASGTSVDAKAALKAVNALAGLLQKGEDYGAIIAGLKALDAAGIDTLTSNNASKATNFKYDLNESGNGIIINKYTDGAGYIVIIPAEIEGYPVVELASADMMGPEAYRSFYENDNIYAVILPNTITKIGRRAFEFCENLYYVNIPTQLVSIGDQAFMDDRNLNMSFVYPSTLKTVGNGALGGTGINELTISEGTEIFNASSFQGCSKLQKITLPASIKTITGFLNNVADLTSLTEIIIPDTVTAITFSGSVFDGCGKLTLATRKKLQELGYTGEF